MKVLLLIAFLAASGGAPKAKDVGVSINLSLTIVSVTSLTVTSTKVGFNTYLVKVKGWATGARDAGPFQTQRIVKGLADVVVYYDREIEITPLKFKAELLRLVKAP